MAIWLARTLPTSLALLLVASLGAPVSAQRLAFRVDSPGSTAYGIVDPATGTSTPVTADDAQLGAVFTSDGQYAVRVVAAGVLQVKHMPSGQQTTVAANFQPYLAHPRRHTLFGISGGSPARFDERGLVRWDACGASPPAAPALDLTVDGHTLYASCPNGDLVGIDTDTGAEVRRVTALGFGSFAVNASASEVVVSRGSGGLFDVVRLDLATLQTLATRRVSSFFGGVGLRATPDHRRVLLTAGVMAGPDVAFATTLIEGTTLADVRALAGSWGYFSGHSAEVSPDGRDAFVVSSGSGGATAAWLDIATGSTLASASVPAGYSLALNYEPVPVPPVLSITQVTAGTATLSWTLPDVSPMVTGYRAEAGTAPGMSNLGVLVLGADESFTASGVPPGRYFVRVRAVNVNGTSGPSNEVVVDVP